MKTDKQIAKQWRSHLGQTKRGLSAQWTNSDLCDAFYANEFNSYKADIDGKRGRVSVQISKARPFVNSVLGFIVQNRRKAKYIARTDDDQAQQNYSKSANAVSDYVRKNSRADQVETQQDKQLLIKGYAATETATTYDLGNATRDPNGEIIKGDVTDFCGWDPSARQTNLLDARWVYYRKSYPRKEAEKLFKQAGEDFEDAAPLQDTGYQFDPNIYPYDRSKYDEDGGYDYDSRDDDTVWVYFYQWYDVETFYRAENPLFKLQNPIVQQLTLAKMQAIADDVDNNDGLFKFDPTAQELTFDSTVKTQLEKMFEELLQTYDYPRKVFYTAVISGSNVFKSFRSASQQGFSIKFKTWDWDNVNKIWFGMVNPMMEPIRYYCKALTELMYTIATNAKGGKMIEDDAVDDISDFEADYNRTDSVVVVRPGALSGGKIQDKRTPYQPTGYEDIIQLSDKSISDVTGIDPTFLGNSQNKLETALLQRQRIRQVTASLAPLFDSITAYQEEDARFMLDLMRIYAENNQGMLVRILGQQDGQTFMRLSKDAFFAEYDIDIQETLQTPEEKGEQAQLLVTIAQGLIQAGDPAGKVALAAAIKGLGLEDEDAQMLRKALAPPDDPRVAQLQQQVQQLTSQQAQIAAQQAVAGIKLTNAQAAYTGAQVQNIHSKIHKDTVDMNQTLADTKKIQVETALAPLVQASKIAVSV